MPVQIDCPNPDCDSSLSVEDENLGELGQCQKCGIQFPLVPGTRVGVLPSVSSVSQTDPDPNPVLQPVEAKFPESFGRYKIVRMLGKGGMGAVYLAHDTQLNRQVALKVPHLHAFTDRPEVRKRFFVEAHAAARFHHPNFCPIHDIGEADGIPYLTMAYIEGKTLAASIDYNQGWPPRRAAEVVRELALALAEAHREGIIHRDLKPANIMVDARGRMVLMDFGLARWYDTVDSSLTPAGAILGTPAYMSPEQAEADLKAIGPRSDVYSLGVILYELLTGRRPFEGSLLMVLGMVTRDEPEPPSKHVPDLDSRLEAICLKAMAKRLENRHDSMDEFARVLGEILHELADASPEFSQSVRANKSTLPNEIAEGLPGVISPRSRLRITSKFTIVAVLLIATGVGVYTMPSWRPLLTANKPDVSGEIAEELKTATEKAAEESAKAAFPARRKEVEAQKTEAELIVKVIEADGLNRMSDVAEELAELWHRHPSRTRWIKEADGRLKSAIADFDRGSYKQALADLETASADYQRVKTWRQNAQVALESVEKTRQELQAKLNALPGDAKRGLVDWPKKLAELVENDIEQDEGEEGKKVADRLANSLPEFDKLIQLRQSAVNTAKDAKLTENLEPYRDRYSSASRRISDGDSELVQFKMIEARRIYNQTRDELVQLIHDEAIDRARTTIAKARKLMQQGSYSEAIKLLEEALAIRPDDADLVRLRQEASRARKIAMIRLGEQSGRPDSAAALMVELSQTEPTNEEVQALVKDFVDRTIAAGKTARDNGKFSEAEACYRRLKNLRPDSEVEQYVVRVKQAEKDAKERVELIAAAEGRERMERQRRAQAEAEEQARSNDAARRGVGNPNSGTLGALGVPAAGGGIYVSGTLPGSPAATAGLEAGDVILSINGSAVNTQQEFVDAVHKSPDEMKFEVRDIRTGQKQSKSVKLNRPK